MKLFKDMVKSSVISIMMSAVLFLIAGVVFDLIGKGTFALEDYRFTKMVLACVVTGLAFGVPSVLYNMEAVPKPLAAVIHMGIGLGVYFAAALLVGWIPVQAGLIACVCTVVGVIVLSLVIWFCFMVYYKNLAEQMNRALQSKNAR